MACSATLSLCSSFAAHCKISSPATTLSHSNSNLSLLSFTSSSSPLKLSRLTFPCFSPKSSASDSSVVLDAASEPATLQPAETVRPPKREEIFAVVMIGGRQYIVIPGRFLVVQRLKGANVGDKIVLNKVLLVGTRTTTWIGKPVVTNAVINAVVEDQGLDDKVIVFKYKKKKNYRRNIGHRQPNTRIRITSITGYQDYPSVTLDS